MSVKEDWDRIVSEIRTNYPERKIEQGDGRIEVNFNPSTFLTVQKDGFAEGSMPLHHFETDEARDVEVSNGITVVRGENFEYLFKE
jgi:hypothetical protein